MLEAEIKSEIRKHARLLGVVLFNNVSGSGELASGEHARFGFMPGASDLIGIRNDGRFVAVEVKTKNGMVKHVSNLRSARKAISQGKKLTKAEKRAYDQDAFVALILANSGIAGFVTSLEEFETLVIR